MFAYATWLLQWARTLGHRFFLQFGLHCATHQIRVILISCVVITSLFYPALDVYTSSRTSSQSILDALLSSSAAATLKAGHDLVDIWSGQDTLRVHEDTVTCAKCQNGHALRVERILIQSPHVEDDGAHKILLSTYDLEQRLQELTSTGDSPCLKKPNGQCFVISPLAFWAYDKDALSSDVSILDTLGLQNVSVAGVPISSDMVLAGRGSYEQHHVGGDDRFDYATFLALTYFFPQNACWGSGAEHAQWEQVVKSAVAQNAEVTFQVPEPNLIALEYDPHRSDSITKSWSAISAFLYIAYIGFFAYVVWSVRRMDAIHSRLGITFTALVEIAVSTITSLSVCALVGFKITMVPWEILPIVIVFVGAENMFNLVDAVGKTSVALPVKQRIAEGLSRAGTSNTLKVVAYNAILGIIAVFSVGAVRQFCTFAIVVLVAHWFLAHTFFMAVLSIDIARLELEELLRRDTSLAPSVPSISGQKDTLISKQPRSAWQKLIFTIQNLLKGRAATNISLLMLLAIAATLYYTTYTTSTSTTPLTSLPKPFGAIARSKASWNGTSSPPAISIAEQIWKNLNPTQTPLLHLRIELPMTITFGVSDVADPSARTTSQQQQAVASSSKYTMRTARFVLWLMTILVLPIAVTTGALWGLLLYLLKNTELLEAQKHRLEPNSRSSSFGSCGNNGEENAAKGLEGKVTFSTLPRVFSSDVELIAASADGKVVVSVGLHNEIVLWNTETKKRIAKIDTSDVLLRMMGMASTSSSSIAASTITCIAVDEDGRYFAVGTGVGLIAAWRVDKNAAKERNAVKALPVMSLEGSSAGVTEMRFVERMKKYQMKKMPGRPAPPGVGSEPSSPESKEKKGKDNATGVVTLLGTYENGTAARWSITGAAGSDLPSVAYFSPSRNAAVIRALLVPVLPDERVLIAFCLDDGTLDLVETGEYELTMLNECILQAGNPYDMVWKVHACRTEIGGSLRLVVAAATESGAVSLWDGLTGECISVLDDANGRINQLRVSTVQSEICHFCGQPPMESLVVAFSVDYIVRFMKLYLNDLTQTRRCSCSRSHAQLRQQGSLLRSVSSRESLGRRSRSNSNTSSSQKGSPLIPRPKLATAFEMSTSPFPVSGHGVHSRRASEKETGRRSSELLTVPFPGNLSGNGDDYDLGAASGNGSVNGDLSGATTPIHAGAYSVWRTATVVPLVDVTCERGGWDVSGRTYVGIRRKPRSQGKSKVAAPGLGATNVVGGSGPSDGLTSATLERWEMWSFDPAIAVLRNSLLVSLAPRDGCDKSSSLSRLPPRATASASSISSFSFSSRTNISSSTAFTSSSGSDECVARLPFTRVSPLLISPSHALAGFGNTIGVFQFLS